MSRLHDLDPSIWELGVWYHPSMCWFCGQPAEIPMHFGSVGDTLSHNAYTLYYNACISCCFIITTDEKMDGRVYTRCFDPGCECLEVG